MLRSALIGGGLALAASQAGAVPVTLQTVGSQVVATDDFGLEGRFAGTGFVFEAEGGSGVPIAEGGRADISGINDALTGFTEEVQVLTIRRADGQAFDLLSVDIPFVGSNEMGSYVGTLPDGTTLDEEIELLVEDIVQITAMTAAGGTVSTAFNPPVPTSFGPDFEDVVSLTFATSGELPDVCAPINLARVDPRFALSADCGDDPESDPFESVTLTNFNNQNDALEYTLGSVTVDSPSPIPVPASLPLVLGGLGALALGARRNSARREG